MEKHIRVCMYLRSLNMKRRMNYFDVLVPGAREYHDDIFLGGVYK